MVNQSGVSPKFDEIEAKNCVQALNLEYLVIGDYMVIVRSDFDATPTSFLRDFSSSNSWHFSSYISLYFSNSSRRCAILFLSEVRIPAPVDAILKLDFVNTIYEICQKMADLSLSLADDRVTTPKPVYHCALCKYSSMVSAKMIPDEMTDILKSWY